MTPRPYYAWLRDVIMVYVVVSVLFAIGLGARPYLTPSEARYIEIPQQMIATGDWLTPRINGVPYFEKPPLFYWMQAAAIKMFGDSEFAGRLVVAKCTALTCLLTYVLGRVLFGRLTGLLSAMALATSLLGYGLSRVSLLDVPVSLFLTLCLACFIAAQKAPALRVRQHLYIVMYVAAALAVMTKGLIGIVIPGLVIGAWIALTGRWRILVEARIFTGLMVVLAITVPWHWLMAREHPEFLDFYFIHEHFTRYMTDEHKRTAPWWFFIAISLAGLLPWTALLPATIKNLKPRLWPIKQADGDLLFLVLWVLLPLVFFSTSHSKLVPYIFPIFPALALLVGRHLADLWQGNLSTGTLRMPGAFVIFFFGTPMILYQWLPLLSGKWVEKLMAAGHVPPLVLLLIAISLGFLLNAIIKQHPARRVIALFAGFAVVLDMSINYLVTEFDHTSVKPLIEHIQPPLAADDMVVAYDSYWQDLPVYLRRNITVAGWQGELGFGVEHYPETKKWMIATDEFWKRCAAEKHRVYVFMTQATYDTLAIPRTCRLRSVANYGKTVLLERQKP